MMQDKKMLMHLVRDKLKFILCPKPIEITSYDKRYSPTNDKDGLKSCFVATW